MPAYAVRGIHFNSGPNELEQAAEREKARSPDGSEGGTVHDESDSEDEGAVPEGVTTSHPVDEDQANGVNGEKGHRSAKSTDMILKEEANVTMMVDLTTAAH